MRVDFLNISQLNREYSFKGMTKKLKKQTYIDGQKDIEQFVEQRGDRSQSVGSLPGFIIKNLPKDNRAAAIKEIYSVFDEVAEEIRNFDETKVYSIEEISKRRNNSTVKKLDDVFKKYGIIKSYDDIDLEYLGKGGKGAGYKIVGLRDNNFDEDEFIIKVFHQIKGDDWQHFKSHGCYAEINSAAYWMHTVGHDTNRGKFFFGNLKSGYMVNKYVDEDVRLPHRVINPYRYGLKYTDEDAKKKHNVVKGYSYDWGGVRVINRLKNGDKYARKISEVIKNTPEKYREQEWYKRLYDRRCANADSKNAGLAMSIKHLNDKEKFIGICLDLKQTKVNRGLAYVLKYLPYRTAIKYFEKLVQTTDDITQIILFNEIPLLAMKHRDDNIKDDLQTTRSEIMPTRIEAYYNLSEKHANPNSIEHLASFVHMLPKDEFRPYYKRLAAIQNDALHDRLIYKFSNVPKEERSYAIRRLAENVSSYRLIYKIYNIAQSMEPDQFKKIMGTIFARNLRPEQYEKIMCGMLKDAIRGV